MHSRFRGPIGGRIGLGHAVREEALEVDPRRIAIGDWEGV